MKLTREELKNIIIDELRNVLKEFKDPEVSIDIQTDIPEEDYNQIQPASHAEAQAILQKQFSIPQRKQ